MDIFLLFLPLGIGLGLLKSMYDTNPFKFPYYTADFSDSLLEYLHTPGVMEQLEAHNKSLASWRETCEEFIKTDPFRKHRQEQYDKVSKESSPFKLNGKSYCFNELWNIYIGQIKEAS